MKWCKQVFPDPLPIVCDLIKETLESLDPPLHSCINLYTQHRDTLTGLIELKQVSARLWSGSSWSKMCLYQSIFNFMLRTKVFNQALSLILIVYIVMFMYPVFYVKQIQVLHVNTNTVFCIISKKN